MRDQPTSWFAGTYDDLCEEDEEYYRRASDRAIKIKELRKSYSRLKTRTFDGKSIRKIYLGKDLLWERGRPIST